MHAESFEYDNLAAVSFMPSVCLQNMFMYDSSHYCFKEHFLPASILQNDLSLDTVIGFTRKFPHSFCGVTPFDSELIEEVF